MKDYDQYVVNKKLWLLACLVLKIRHNIFVSVRAGVIHLLAFIISFVGVMMSLPMQ
jgi:hypothetical protein